MAIEVRVSRGYAWRMIIIAVASLIFGLWGVYDYVVAIPRDQQLADRLDLLRVSKNALAPDQPPGQPTPPATSRRRRRGTRMRHAAVRETGAGGRGCRRRR